MFLLIPQSGVVTILVGPTWAVISLVERLPCVMLNLLDHPLDPLRKAVKPPGSARGR